MLKQHVTLNVNLTPFRVYRLNFVDSLRYDQDNKRVSTIWENKNNHECIY
jgi:hypothetical protein